MAEIQRLTEKGEIGSSKIGIFERNLDPYYKLHWHEYFEVEFFTSGNCNYKINEHVYETKPGTLVFLTPTDFSSVERLSEESSLINISFAESWVSEKIYSSLTSHCVIENYESHHVFKLLKEYNSGGLFDKMYLKNLLNCLLIDIIRHNEKINSISTRSAEKPNVISKALCYIQLHFRNNISLSDVAKHVGFSSNYLSKIFHKHTNQTFKTYLLETRLKYAEALLINTDSSITEICFNCGFSNFSHFMRCFKEKYSISPLKYRKKYSKDATD